MKIPDSNFSFLFQDGDLRKINMSGEEIIQRIYFAVRDEEWLNIPYVLEDIKEENVPGRTTCSYTLNFCKSPVEFRTIISFTLEENTLTIEANGKARTSFLKNRIGFCVHLPVALKERSCKVVHTDGTFTASTFPRLISPHQPFKNMVSIEWFSGQGKVTLSFEGDVFEMEDQRNWTDASYKIYSTPLDLPFPVAVNKDSTFFQRLVLSVNPEEKEMSDTVLQDRGLADNKIVPWPKIGWGGDHTIKYLSSSRDNDHTAIPFSYYRVDFRFCDTDWKKYVDKEIALAYSLGLTVEANLYLGEEFEKEIQEFIQYINEIDKDIKFHSIALLSYNDFVLKRDILQVLLPLVRSFFPEVPVGAGTDANFAQLNRNRPDTQGPDYLCYSIQPQEHASDPLSLIENLQGQSDTVQTALSFSNGKAIHISSLSFYRRFNANVDVISRSNIIPEYNYQNSYLEAGWFIGAFHQLIRAGVEGITCCCSIGEGSPLATFFRYLSDREPEYFYTLSSPCPEQYSILSWISEEQQYTVFANHTDEEIRIKHPNTELVLDAYDIAYVVTTLPEDQGV